MERRHDRERDHWLRVSLKFNAEKFPAGIPNIKVEKQGRAVYDPRTGLTGYSNNAALVIPTITAIT